jgi:hypothetical protein
MPKGVLAFGCPDGVEWAEIAMDGFTRDAHSLKIDSFRARHPESEDAYEEWKIKHSIA